jgi:fructose-1,6-bisphosphatase
MRTREEKNAYGRAWYAANREEIAAKQKAYRAVHKEEIIARQKAWREAHKEEKTAYYEAHKEEVMSRQLKRNFGITLAEYDQMLEDQHGICAICGGVNPDGKRLAVDHDHETGKVRGLLCTSCNTRLGFLEIHRDAIRQYLARSK